MHYETGEEVSLSISFDSPFCGSSVTTCGSSGSDCDLFYRCDSFSTRTLLRQFSRHIRICQPLDRSRFSVRLILHRMAKLACQGRDRVLTLTQLRDPPFGPGSLTTKVQNINTILHLDKFSISGTVIPPQLQGTDIRHNGFPCIYHCPIDGKCGCSGF